MRGRELKDLYRELKTAYTCWSSNRIGMREADAQLAMRGGIFPDAGAIARAREYRQLCALAYRLSFAGPEYVLTAARYKERVMHFWDGRRMTSGEFNECHRR